MPVRIDGVDCLSARPGRVVWHGEQLAAFPSTKIAKPTRSNHTKAADSCVSGVFPTSAATYLLLRIPLLAPD